MKFDDLESYDETAMDFASLNIKQKQRQVSHTQEGSQQIGQSPKKMAKAEKEVVKENLKNSLITS